ncbi:hypothetical protein HF877_01790 [Rhodococcus sp. BL-253-APC-6A1W]|uniref:hypothetical protein n=1 Tax=Rhodococcus sp. BL-253-APC-6A1W TaxID=2725307 RepID=UPI00146A4C6D|nr:hypothetical protein [Rhodococcus sp. BL-253-APC-6A1W]NMD94137.1 hypothetical protein [Rhodococcus sp. BL-253-APC-6A1W]
MTENRRNDTGQVSVAELLARNGQKVNSRSGGRRRRGTSGGISVAELTGEIPITRADDSASAGTRSADAAPQVPKVEPVAPSVPRVEFVVPETPRVEPVVPVTPQVEVPELVTPAPPSATELTTVTARPEFGSPTATPKSGLGAKPTIASRSTSAPRGATSGSRGSAPSAAAVREAPKVESPTEVIRPAALPRRARAHLGISAPDTQSAPVPTPRGGDVAEPRLLSGPASDLQGTGTEDENDPTDTYGFAEPVGDARKGAPGSAAGDGADTPARGKRRRKNTEDVPEKASPRKVAPANPSDVDEQTSGRTSRDDRTDDAPQDGADDEPGGSSLKQWALLITESVAAVAAGALLFKGFEKLWDMMPWVAFGLALLVIVGLVALVRILRRTDDIASQLIALAVGVFVAFGPLLFLMPNG